MRTSLFGRTSLNDYFTAIQRKMVEEINAIPIGEIARADVDRLAADLAEKYRVACPVIEEGISYDPPPFSPSPTVTVTVYVPFTGNPELFHCHGGSSPTITEAVEVKPSQLVIRLPVEKQRVGDV